MKSDGFHQVLMSLRSESQGAFKLLFFCSEALKLSLPISVASTLSTASSSELQEFPCRDGNGHPPSTFRESPFHPE